jgi:hypothetical protein
LLAHSLGHLFERSESESMKVDPVDLATIAIIATAFMVAAVGLALTLGSQIYAGLTMLGFLVAISLFFFTIAKMEEHGEHDQAKR